MEVSDKLTKLLSKANQQQTKLDKKLATSCQQFFTQSIEFRPASGHDSHLENLKSRYKPLNKVIPNVTMETTRPDENTSNSKQSTPKSADVIPAPRKVLYSSDHLDLKWKQTRSIGSGLGNMGNTCFLNSVLQCLAYTPPLYNYLTSGDHKQSCNVQGFCTMCEFQRHCNRVFSTGNGYVKPIPIVQNLRAIAKHFRMGRQEDAHEFLRYFIDGLQKSCLHGYPAKLDPHSKATTVVHQIFGGYHRSQVKCLQCHKTSNTYDPLLDVSLDIKNCNTIVKALNKSIKPDLLEGDNSYACPFCKKMTNAEKKFTIQRLPKVLTLQLKRFDFNSMFGGKVNKSVAFPEYIDMRHYMSDTQGPSEWYKLFGVLVHFGFSSHSGHYYCYVRNSNGCWYCMNDSQVTQVSVNTVLQQEAYLLFYIKDESYSPPEKKIGPSNLASKSPGQQKNNMQKQVRSDPNFLSTPKKQSVGLDKMRTPLVHRLYKPTGVVPPSPKVIQARTGRDKSFLTNGKLTQEFSIPITKTAVSMPTDRTTSTSVPEVEGEPAAPLRPTFVPRQIKTAGKSKKTLKERSKEKLVLMPSLSPLPELDEDNKEGEGVSSLLDDAIPVSNSIQLSNKDATQTTSDRTILDFANSIPSSSLPSEKQSLRFIGPLRQSPPSKMTDTLISPPKVALVPPQPQSGAVLGSSSRPVAMVRPSPHVTTTTSNVEGSSKATAPNVKVTVVAPTAMDDKDKSGRGTSPRHMSTPPPSSPQVDSTTSGDITASPQAISYGPELSSDHVTSTLSQTTPSPKSQTEFKFSSSLKHSKKKRYRKHSLSEVDLDNEASRSEEGSEKSPLDDIVTSSKKKLFVSEHKRLSDGDGKPRHKSSHNRDKSPVRDRDSRHKHKKHHRGHRSETPSRNGRVRETDRHSDSGHHSKKKRRERHSHRHNRSRSRSPFSRAHSRRSDSPNHSSHYRRHQHNTPVKYSHRHRNHSHRSSSSIERVKHHSRSRSRSPCYKKHEKTKSRSSRESSKERVKESPLKRDSVFSSPDDEMRRKKRKRDRQEDERGQSPTPEGKRHKTDILQDDSGAKQSRNNVPEVAWDSTSKSMGSAKWDGSRCIDTLEQLTGQSKLGGTVKSWTGGENSIDSTVTQKTEGVRRDRDSWDEELDKGKIKKVKRKIKDDFNSSNKFQEMHNKKSSQSSSCLNDSSDKSHHHKPHHHHKGHHPHKGHQHHKPHKAHRH